MKIVTRVYEDEETISTWTYDLDKFKNGPISVDIKYKNEPVKKRSGREKNPNKK
jgi:hypothetical protein